MLLVKLNNSVVLNIDSAVTQWMIYIQQANIATFLHTIAHVFSPILVIIYMCILLLPFLKRRIVMPFMEVMVGYISMEIIKVSVARTRPADKLVNVLGYSFPSAHTFEIILVLLVLLGIIKQILRNTKTLYFIQIFLFSITFLVLFSRLYLRVHFFSDVAAGVFLAYGWHSIWQNIANKLTKNLHNC
ncbi:PA-phosphatase-like phosphoesterase [Liquorilactobacillus hordei DSM 19519]|uniref:PA-phosphatase-like phosphoesterase n=2 Tax=Liquorilactobacillus hordei TaxID=468911 RepID=A0A0R1M9W2_9LACO|nr:PA-phosphatase-like phosphoesterase [Liquorilactobacillus hordei DSM 19519]